MIKMAMLTSEIDKVLRRLAQVAPIYIGCFPADGIPSPVIFPHCMVVNLDPSWAVGSHWIALYRSHPNRIEYYDSLGIWPPQSQQIAEYLAKVERIYYSRLPLQSVYSSTCGKHVIFFLYHRCNGASMEEIIGLLHSANNPDLMVNEFARAKIFAQ